MTTAALKTVPVDRPIHITRSLLGYGVIAGPIYTVASLIQALTRDGFDLTRHQWSLLANGGPGWIQVVNFMLAGLMTIAGAVGLRRALASGRSATWGPRLVGVFGLGLIGAGVFRADPALGFPPGAPDGVGEVTVAGSLHFVVAGIGFGCLVAACFVLARRFTAEGRRGWAVYSRATGVLFLGGFVGVASGNATVATNLGFVAAVLIAWGWLSAISVHHYRRQYHLMTEKEN